MTYDLSNPTPLRIASWLLEAHRWPLPAKDGDVPPEGYNAMVGHWWCSPNGLSETEHRTFQETLRTAWNGEYLSLHDFERMDAMCRAQGTTLGKCIARLLAFSYSEHPVLEAERRALYMSLKEITDQLWDGEPHDEILYAATYRWWPVHGLIGMHLYS